MTLLLLVQYPYHQMEVKLLLGLYKMMEMEMRLVMYAFLRILGVLGLK